jgi:DNA-binding LytR/AlgR family response regulator
VANRAKVAIYSDDSSVRGAVKAALGSKLAEDLEIESIEFATADAFRLYVDQTDTNGKVRADLIIVDGEAVPEGGLGVARQLKDEVFNCPPVIVLIARQADAWLAAWSRAEASLQHPIDAFSLAKTAEDLLRTRLSLTV